MRIGLARCWLKSPLRETVVVLAVSVVILLPVLGVAVRFPLANPLILLFVDVGCCCGCCCCCKRSRCPTTVVAAAAGAGDGAEAGAEAEMLSNSVIAS